MARRAKGWGVEVMNLQEAVEAFKETKAAFGATPLKACLIGVAERIRDRAKELCPVGTGLDTKGRPRPHLRDLIFATYGKAGSPSVIVGVDRKKAPHAHLVEFKHDLWRGGRKKDGAGHFVKEVEARPYLRPAFDSVKRAAVALVGKEINDRIISKLTNRRNGLARPRVYSGVTDVTDLVEKYGPGVPVKPGEMVSP